MNRVFKIETVTSAQHAALRNRRRASPRGGKRDLPPAPGHVIVLGLDEEQIALAADRIFPNAIVNVVASPEELVQIVRTIDRAVVVAVPLISEDWDALEIAVDLAGLSRRQVFLKVVAGHVPNPKMVLSELRRKASSINVDLLDITRPPRPHKLG